MTKITVAKGDGIGPEIMDATLRIIQAAGAQLDIDEIDVGEKVYLAGNTAGISDEAWETIRRNKIFLKAPITTPQGGGYKSLNVTTRKTLGLFANVRPCKSLHPYISTKHPKMDVVIVRENEEDLYAGIEHQQTDEVVQCLKLISRPGCEKIITYAFEYAKKFGRKNDVLVRSINQQDIFLQWATHHDKICVKTDDSVYITINGAVTPCCNLRNHSIGNLKNSIYPLKKYGTKQKQLHFIHLKIKFVEIVMPCSINIARNSCVI